MSQLYTWACISVDRWQGSAPVKFTQNFDRHGISKLTHFITRLLSVRECREVSFYERPQFAELGPFEGVFSSERYGFEPVPIWSCQKDSADTASEFPPPLPCSLRISRPCALHLNRRHFSLFLPNAYEVTWRSTTHNSVWHCVLPRKLLLNLFWKTSVTKLINIKEWTKNTSLLARICF